MAIHGHFIEFYYIQIKKEFDKFQVYMYKWENKLVLFKNLWSYFYFKWD